MECDREYLSLRISGTKMLKDEATTYYPLFQSSNFKSLNINSRVAWNYRIAVLASRPDRLLESYVSCERSVIKSERPIN